MPYQAELATVGTQEGLKATAAEAADPERFFTNNLCWNHYNGCARDIRLYRWARVATASSSRCSSPHATGRRSAGHVWATRTGPAKRPGVVITNGSVQAEEQMCWYAAQGHCCIERSHHDCAERSPVPCHVWRARGAGRPLSGCLRALRGCSCSDQPKNLRCAWNDIAQCNSAGCPTGARRRNPWSMVRPGSQVQVAEAGGLQGGDVPLAGVLLGVDVPGHGQPAAGFVDGSESLLVAPRVEALEK